MQHGPSDGGTAVCCAASAQALCAVVQAALESGLLNAEAEEVRAIAPFTKPHCVGLGLIGGALSGAASWPE